MPAEELEKTTDIDPDALMREYKQTGSLEVRNQLVMYYSYIARSMAVKMSSTYHKYATTEEMVNQCVIALGAPLSIMSANRTGCPAGCGRWISAS